MEGSIASLNATLGQAASGFPRAEKMLSRFGLKAKDARGQIKTFDQMLDEVGDKMEGASTGKRLAMANALGIDPKLIPLLREGSANFDRLREEALKAGAFKDSDYERAHESEKLFNKAEGAFLRLKQRLAIGLLPTVNELLKKFTAWVSDSKNIARIQGYIDSVVKVAKLLWENASKIAAVFAVIYAHKYGMMFLDWGAKIMAVAKGLGAAQGATKLLGVGFTALKGLLASGLLGLLALLIEDLITFEKGGRSVTGWMVDKFHGGAEAMKLAIAGVGAAALRLITGSGPLALIIVGFVAWVVAIRDISKEWEILTQEIERGLKRISDNPAFKALDYLLDKLNGIGGGGGLTGMGVGPTANESRSAVDILAKDSTVGQKDPRSLWDQLAGNHLELIPGHGGDRGGIPADWQAAGAGIFRGTETDGFRMDRANAAQMSVSQDNRVTFHISGVTDPKAVAAEIERKLNSMNLPDMGKLNRDQTRNGQPGVR
jgi:hypothetical protein